MPHGGPHFEGGSADSIAAQQDSEEVDFGSAVWGTNEEVRLADILVTPEIGYGSADTTERMVDQGWGVRQSGEELLQGFYQLTPAQLQNLQMQLLLNGYDTRTDLDDVNFGAWDPKSFNAYAKAINAAARSGLSLYEILHQVELNEDNMKARFGSGGRRGGGGAGRVHAVQRASQQDLEEAALRGFQAALGHAPDETQKQAFISEFRKRETAAQPDTSGGGTFEVTDPGNPMVLAETMAKQQAPEQAQSYARLQAFGVMLQALGVQP